MNKILTVVSLAAVLSIKTMAHEGHGIPGALPPAPHGGVVQETEHKSENKHSAAEEVELFFEAVYKDKELNIYPLTLAAGNTTTFTALSPTKDISNVVLKIEFPRTKKMELLKTTVTGNSIRAPFDAKNLNRFIIHVSATQKNELKATKLQIETNP